MTYVGPSKLIKLAPLDSPEFTGVPLVPTAPLGTSTNQIASTSFVMAALAALLSGNTGTITLPPTTTPTIIDEEEDMAITPFNLSSPSQTLVVNSSNTPTSMVIDNLALIATQNPTGTSFKVEFYNNSPDLVYFVLATSGATLVELTCYVIEPSERRIFVVTKGFNTVTATMGGSTSSTGELRTTVLAYGS